jgi:hypothetical protein
MIHVTAAAAPAACSTGTWTQKWDCGWHQPTTGAAHLGTPAGHGFAAALITLAVVVALVLAVRVARRSGKAAPASK